jgi:hypothetical protein
MPDWLIKILSDLPDDGNWGKRRRMAILQRWPLGRQAEAQADASLGRPALLRQMTDDINAIKAAVSSGRPPSVDTYGAAVQAHLDAAAYAAGYDNIQTAVSYADEPAVAKFQTEGQAFRAWRSLVWAHCYAVLAEVQAATRSVPTEAELVAELPDLVLP